MSASPRNRARCGLAPPTFRAKRTNERARGPGLRKDPLCSRNERPTTAVARRRALGTADTAAVPPKHRARVRYLVVIAHLIDGQRHTDAILLYQDHDAAGFRAAAVDPTATAATGGGRVGRRRLEDSKTGTAVKKGRGGRPSREEGSPERERWTGKKKNKNDKDKRQLLISDQRKRKYTKHGCPTIIVLQ